MDIGTAKATAEERRRVVHYGLDIADPDRQYDVRQFSDSALSVIGGLSGTLFCVGGSGFYLQTLYDPVCDSVAIAPPVRDFVRNIQKTDGLDGLLRELDRRCGGTQLSIDRCNPRRVARALERAIESGEPPAVSAEKFANGGCAFGGKKIFTIYVEQQANCHEASLRRRIGEMLCGGLVEETQNLRQMGFERNPSACGAVGYRETLAFLDGTLVEDELAGRIFFRTRQLCRKQRTWFRHKLPFDMAIGNGEADWPMALKAVDEFVKSQRH
jgi:tRNA dimethylallyltransferase